jgi:hypothetical protein
MSFSSLATAVAGWSRFSGGGGEVDGVSFLGAFQSAARLKDVWGLSGFAANGEIPVVGEVAGGLAVWTSGGETASSTMGDPAGGEAKKAVFPASTALGISSSIFMKSARFNSGSGIGISVPVGANDEFTGDLSVGYGRLEELASSLGDMSIACAGTGGGAPHA